MKKQEKNKKHITTIISFILIILISTFLINFPSNSVNRKTISEDNYIDKTNELKSPSLSASSASIWWNSSYEYRIQINITNSMPENFTNFITSVDFNYTEWVDNHTMRPDLGDIRVVENNILRPYYFQKDFSQKDLVTVWFETNISIGSEVDTYIYFNNSAATIDYNYYMDKNPDGLIWYKFEEDFESRGEVVDSMGNYNATLHGASRSSTKAIGNYSASFDGNDWLAIQGKEYENPNQLTELTVLVWFKTGMTSGDWTQNWAFFDFDRSEYFNFFIRPDNGRLYFCSAANGWDETYNQWEGDTGDDNYDDFYGSTTGLANDEWHFGAATYDGTDKALYSDGGVAGGFVEDALNDNAHSGLGMGRTTDRFGIIGDGSESASEDSSRNNRYYTGNLDEIRYFEEGLSADRISWFAKNYTVTAELKTPEEKKASITIIAKDIDGRVIPGLKIFMNSTSSENYTDTTSSNGVVEFGSVVRQTYNITAKYSLFNGTDTFEEVLFNSSVYNIEYDFGSVDEHTVILNVSAWTIDFEVEDWEYNPMGYGYVLVYNSSDYTDLIANLTLTKEFGTASFIWYNRSVYSYEIYYNNADYTLSQTLLGNNTVDRATYSVSNLNDITHINVNETNIEGTPGQFHVNESVYATDSNSTHIGNTKIINATIGLAKMNYSLTSVDIYTIDINNEVSASPIYSRPPPAYSSPFQRSDTITLNVTEYANAYGLLIDVKGTNSSIICNGTIDVNYTESCNQYMRTNMSKLEIKVYDINGEWDETYGSVFVVITNATDDSDITTLLTNEQGIAEGQINSDIGFWYLNHNASYSHKYNFTLFYAGSYRNFNASVDPPNFNNSFNDWYNYTLYGNGSIEFRIQTSMEFFKSELRNFTGNDANYEWGSNFTFGVNFTSTDDNGATWEAITNPDYVNWEITDILGDEVFDSGEMKKDLSRGIGCYNKTINSTSLVGGVSYYFRITGEKTGFQEPDPLSLLFTVAGKGTSLGVYTQSGVYLGLNRTEYYSETASFLIRYSSGTYLSGASVSYDW